jgi:hypothetical protein
MRRQGRGQAPEGCAPGLLDVVDFVAGNTKASPNAVFAGSVPYLMLAGNLMAGWQMARPAGGRGPAGRGRGRLHAGQDHHRPFYADHILSKAPGVRDSIVDGADSVTEMALEAF